MQAGKGGFAAIFAGFSFVTGVFSLANAAPAPFVDDVAFSARLQCRLLLEQYNPRPPADDGKALDAMMGQPNFHLYAGNLLEYLKRTAWEPDFGFLLGQHWQTLTLVQRNSFNSLMRNIVIKEYIPGKADDVTRNCEMNVTAFEKQSSNTRTHGPLPWPRPMQASAKTSLGEGKGGLSYIYESNPDGRWELLNLVITQARPLAWQPSLRELYARTLTGIIMREGFEGLKKHLTEQLVGSAPHDGTVTKD